MSEGALMCPVCGDMLHPLDEDTIVRGGELCHIDCDGKDRCEVCTVPLSFVISRVCMNDKRKSHTYCFACSEKLDPRQICVCDTSVGVAQDEMPANPLFKTTSDYLQEAGERSNVSEHV